MREIQPRRHINKVANLQLTLPVSVLKHYKQPENRDNEARPDRGSNKWANKRLNYMGRQAPKSMQHAARGNKQY